MVGEVAGVVEQRGVHAQGVGEVLHRGGLLGRHGVGDQLEHHHQVHGLLAQLDGGAGGDDRGGVERLDRPGVDVDAVDGGGDVAEHVALHRLELQRAERAEHGGEGEAGVVGLGQQHGVEATDATACGRGSPGAGPRGRRSRAPPPPRRGRRPGAGGRRSPSVDAPAAAVATMAAEAATPSTEPRSRRVWTEAVASPVDPPGTPASDAVVDPSKARPWPRPPITSAAMIAPRPTSEGSRASRARPTTVRAMPAPIVVPTPARRTMRPTAAPARAKAPLNARKVTPAAMGPMPRTCCNRALPITSTTPNAQVEEKPTASAARDHGPASAAGSTTGRPLRRPRQSTASAAAASRAGTRRAAADTDEPTARLRATKPDGHRGQADARRPERPWAGRCRGGAGEPVG